MRCEQSVFYPFPRLKVFGATFFQKGSKKTLTQANSLLRFFFDTQGAKKKARKKKRRFMGSAQTRKLLKKLDQNFPAWVQCEHSAFIRRAQNVI